MVSIESDCPNAIDTLVRYINSCSTKEGGGQGQGRGQDDKFEKMVLACASDDQKEVRERLKGIWEQAKAIVQDSNENLTNGSRIQGSKGPSSEDSKESSSGDLKEQKSD